NHHTIVFLIPCSLVVLWKYRKSHYLTISLTCALLFFLLGFSVYMYLPIRSVQNPALDWSNPETLSGMIRVITRKDYGTFALTVGEAQKRTLNVVFKQVIRYFSALKSDMTIFGMLLSFAGWVAFFKRGRVLFAVVNFILFILSSIGFLIVGNLPFDPLSDGILERFYVLPLIPLCLSAGYGIALAGEFFKKKNLSLAVAVFAFIPILFAVNSFKHCNFRQYFLVYDYGKNILRTLKPNSIFFMDGGDDTFYSTAYLCFAEKRRRDVELHDRGGLVFKNVYGSDFRSLTRDEKEKRRKKIEQMYVDSNRPVFYSTFNKDILAPTGRVYPNGILYEAVNPAAVKPDASLSATTSTRFDSWILYSLLRGAYNTYSDYRSRALAPVYVFMHSMTLAEPLLWWNYAYSRWGTEGGVIWLTANLKTELHNKAYSAFNDGKLSLAEQYYRNILEIDSNDLSAILNLGVIAERKNQIEEAKKIYQELIFIKPNYPEVYYNLGVLYWKEENWEKVVECFSKVLELNPGHSTARQYLPQAIARQKK
ncbi:MAG: tetratricopeptide repeat protein, partial [Elusimicrobiota bacterium]|nr:tetratricopeptide repeat protein [Elusimicrobiota bacterium]